MTTAKIDNLVMASHLNHTNIDRGVLMTATITFAYRGNCSLFLSIASRSTLEALPVNLRGIVKRFPDQLSDQPRILIAQLPK